MANARQRGGMTISLDGKEGPLGNWFDHFESYPADSLVQRAGRVRDGALVIGKRLYKQTRAQIEKRTDFPLAEPQVRLSMARAEQKTLEKLRADLAKVQIERIKRDNELQPFSYHNTGPLTSPADSLAGRAELRTVFRSLDLNARREALQDRDMRRAILEQPGFASGISAKEHADIYRAERESRFANELKELADTDLALEQVNVALETVMKAVESEIKNVGAPVVEPPPKTPSNEWA
jgi:hypothetical protein